VSRGTAPELPTDPRQDWAFLGQEERDAAYDNNAAVADSAAQIEVRNRLSAERRAKPGALLDLAYAPGERTRWDLYPAADPAAPCFVFIHGGYWLRNSRELFAMLADGMGAHGWSVALPGYTLAPEATLTQIAAEMQVAMDWLAASGPEYGIGGPVVVSGWSAGAQLAALLLSHPLVVAGLAISGVYELGPIRDTKLNDVLKLTEDEVRQLSPLRLPVVAKPLAIVYGTSELPPFVWDARRFHAMRAAACAPSVLVPMAEENHFSILDHLRRSDGQLVRLALTLLEGVA
jgi:arylformamidase